MNLFFLFLSRGGTCLQNSIHMHHKHSPFGKLTGCWCCWDRRYALRQTAIAADAGVIHRGIHWLGSTWFGPTRDIVLLSQYTMAFSRLLKAYLFGPGTTCLAVDATVWPGVCSWDKGLYPGVMLLYRPYLTRYFGGFRFRIKILVYSPYALFGFLFITNRFGGGIF